MIQENLDTKDRSLLKKRMAIMLLLVVLLLGGIIGFNFFKQRAIQKYMQSAGVPPQVVTTQVVHLSQWVPSIDAVSTLRAVRGVNLSSESAGLIKEVMFHSGQNVKANQILLVINHDAETAQLKVLEAAVHLAKLVYERDKKQYDYKAISLAQLQADEADYQSKTAQVNEQNALIEKKIIRAPFSGRLGITTVNPGQYLNVGDKIVTLQQLSPILVDFTIPQEQLKNIKPNQPITLTTDAWPQVVFHGVVDAISSDVDSATRNIAVQGAVKNDENKLMPGMFANLHWQYGEPSNILTLPQTAISYNPYGATVFLVDKQDGKKSAKQVFVTTGTTRGDQVAVLSGIKEGDEVVTSGQMKLKTGIPIIVTNQVEPPNSAQPTPQEH